MSVDYKEFKFQTILSTSDFANNQELKDYIDMSAWEILWKSVEKWNSKKCASRHCAF